ncbi:DUF4347 domain-containing protein [Laspinema palackyanum]|uniref:DUF4347 domain-containing protein n=1 Tax=Laspinema palackyanum TaxID=3231601 RepID=UPI00345CB2EE|nr:DUF4347 domain-containing protein [Laspinema sp. D2c]
MNHPQSHSVNHLSRISKRYKGLDTTPEPPIQGTPPLTESRTLVFIDAGVSEQQTLLDALTPDTEAIVLDGDRDGIDQIMEAIAGRTNIDSIHLVSHGSSGRVQLGTTQLDAETLDAYLPQWQNLRAALSEGADILLYGCNVGTSDAGITFLQKLAELTGADIAASDDLTGSAELNGNWTLEVRTGNIEAPLPFQSEAIAGYNALLAEKIYTVNAEDVNDLITKITAANNDGQDSIINLGGGTYTLTDFDNSLLGANGLPSIQTDKLTINGNGAQIVRAQGASGFRIFHVGANAHLTLNNLTVKNGWANIPSTPENNNTSDGGGIYNAGTLTLKQSTITGNRAEDDGGGINNAGTLTVIDSSISNNVAKDEGGGIRHTDNQFLTVIGSTINNNEAGKHGGGIQNSSTADISNTTISNNRAANDGGGLYSEGNLTVNHSTIAFNTADRDGKDTGNGGGIFNFNNEEARSYFDISHTIVAGNTDNSPGDVHRDISGPVSRAEYNLIGDWTGIQNLTADTNYSFKSLGVSDINAVITPTLALNGAPTGSPLTHALTLGSPAIDLGDLNLNTDLVTDQRGNPFQREVGEAIDIGAYEKQVLPVITEIMYHPRNDQPHWEWVEIYNPTDQPLDLTGFVFANAGANLEAANINGGTIAAGKTGILFNTNLSPEAFKAGWDTGEIPLIPVSNWPELGLGNTSDRIGLWRNFSNYTLGFTTAIDEVAYDTTGGWPTPSPGASLYLNSLTFSEEDLRTANDNGSNWLTSAIGQPGEPTAVVAKAYESTLAGTNSGLDIGSPGPTDSIPPGFKDFMAQEVTTVGGTTYSFSVTFTDNRAIDWSTLDIGDILVTGPKNESLQVTAIATPNYTGNSPGINVTYQITPPGGRWDKSDNGTYTVTLQRNQVTDTTGNAIAAELGSFLVNINNTPPTLETLNQTSPQNTPFFFKPEYFTNQFTDADGDTLQTISITSLPTTGTLLLDGKPIQNPQEIPLTDIQKLSFVPNEKFNGPVSFTWNGFDGTDYAKTDSTVNLNINANTPPTLETLNQTGTKNTPFFFKPEYFTNQFTDADGDTLKTISITSLPTNGTLILDGKPIQNPGEIALTDIQKLSFVPNENFNGPVSFTWNGFDGTDYAKTDSTVNLNINAPPILLNPLDNQTTTPGTNFNFPIPNNTFYDADIIAFKDRLTYTVTLANGNPIPDWLTFKDDGTFTGTPGRTDIGTLPIIVTVTDQSGASITDTFDLTIQSPNGGGGTGGGNTGGSNSPGTGTGTGTDGGSNNPGTGTGNTGTGTNGGSNNPGTGPGTDGGNNPGTGTGNTGTGTDSGNNLGTGTGTGTDGGNNLGTGTGTGTDGGSNNPGTGTGTGNTGSDGSSNNPGTGTGTGTDGGSNNPGTGTGTGTDGGSNNPGTGTGTGTDGGSNNPGTGTGNTGTGSDGSNNLGTGTGNTGTGSDGGNNPGTNGGNGNSPLIPDSPVNGDRPESENPPANPPNGIPHTNSTNTCNPVPSDPSPSGGCKCPVPPPPEIIFYGPQDRPPVEIFLFGTEENDVIFGDDRHEGILGFAGHDFLWGKGGTDVLYGDTGDDYMLGGVGSEFPVGPGIDRDRIEGGKGNDFINGNEGNDTLYGGRENDIIHGGKDDDLILGNLDNDILYGDLGNDTILGGNGSETPIGPDGDRDLIFGNRGNDLINGNEGDDTIYSGKDDDIAYGGKDNDLIYGDLGNDILMGDQGDDSLFGGTSDPNVPDIGGRDLIYGGDGNDFINGNQGDDTLHGGNGNDTIHGGKDHDIVCGSAGDDLLFGDLGDDTLYGEDGNDTIRGGIGSDVPLGSVGDRDFLCAGAGDDWLEGNAGNDTLIGGSGNDTLYGGKDDDLLYGGDGDDFLSGDLGNDTLTGGTGRDRFVVQSGFGTDLIADFTPGEDSFVLGEGLTFNLLNFFSYQCGTAIALGDEILAIAKGIEPQTMVAEYFIPLT